MAFIEFNLNSHFEILYTKVHILYFYSVTFSNHFFKIRYFYHSLAVKKILNMTEIQKKVNIINNLLVRHYRKIYFKRKRNVL